jgi:hypothetical protein
MKESAVSSHLRLVTASTLVAFGCVIGVGALALFPTAAKQPPVGNPAISDSGATPCKQQSWLRFDRSCLTRRDLPWIAGPGTANAPGADKPAVLSLTESPDVAASLQEVASQSSPPAASLDPLVLRASVRQDVATQTAAPQEQARTASVAGPQQSVAFAPQELVPQKTLQPGNTTAPNPLVQRSKPVIDAAARPLAQKKTAGPQRTAKRSRNEDLNGGQKQGDKLHAIPVTSYAADGTQRTVVIRPTSIQDAYYYSAPR